MYHEPNYFQTFILYSSSVVRRYCLFHFLDILLTLVLINGSYSTMHSEVPSVHCFFVMLAINVTIMSSCSFQLYVMVIIGH